MLLFRIFTYQIQVDWPLEITPLTQKQWLKFGPTITVLLKHIPNIMAFAPTYLSIYLFKDRPLLKMPVSHLKKLLIMA